jgi:hypothetical protein
MNKKSLDKIDIFSLDYTYNTFIKEIFNIKNLDEFMTYINNDIDKIYENEHIYNRLLEYCWYVFMDEIIINKNKFINFYVNILSKIYKINIQMDKFEKLYNDNIKKYIIEKNNINYHKIILESIV